jgi:hypothetical protein
MPPGRDPLAGWERRVVVDRERARELSELYAAAGFEVRVATTIPEDFSESCAPCPLVHLGLLRIVYTRRKGETS